jgi:predicted transcriptional regulator
MDEPKKKPEKSRLNLWISNETSKSLDDLAKERGVSASSIAETALRHYLERDRVYREAETKRQAYLDELLTGLSVAEAQAKLSAPAKPDTIDAGTFDDSTSEPKKEGDS